MNLREIAEGLKDGLASIDQQPRSILIGLIGSGIQLSRSPRMHELEGKRLGISYVYRLIDLEALGIGAGALPDLLDSAERLGFSGLNITHPCKQTVIPFLTEIADDAAAIGAVNTVVFKAGKRMGYNTDCWGFAESFRRGLPGVSLSSVIQLGAGGAGAAVGRALLELGCSSLSIFDTDTDKAKSLAGALGRQFELATVQSVSNIETAIAQADGIVNATPIGMAKYPGTPVPDTLIRPNHWVSDVIYFPAETELIRLARSKGCRTLPGAGMAVFQAVKAFELFTGVTPDAKAMHGHFGAVDGDG